MYYKIWKKDIIPVEEGIVLCYSSPIDKKYKDKEEALQALDELANNNFEMSKYKKKTVESISKNGNSYIVNRWYKNKIIQEIFCVRP